jgi:uncharacterized protein YbjT (DUF2867 family)
MKILVTGASGYVGGRLVPRLLAERHTVRASFSDPAKASRLWWHDDEDVEIVEMDVLDADEVSRAVEGVDAVYYLIHGMGGDDFAAKDRRSAANLARAAADAGVERIVYLSGLVPDVPESELSEHISSRLEVERILTASGVTTISLRAAVVVGAGSTSFEIIRQISERLPVTTVPDWMRSLVQPIAITDVIEALVGALTVESGSRSYDVGGPERMPYPDLLKVYADVADLRRPQVNIPGLPTDLVGTLAGLITDVPSSTVEALVESLHHDMVCRENDFTVDLMPEDHEFVGLRESFRRALAKPSGRSINPATLDPIGPMPHDPAWSGGSGGGVASLIAGATAVVTGTLGALGKDSS